MNTKKRILIVDDNPASINMVVTALEEEGYSISVAKSGEKALELAERVKPDLILLDILMPGMDGYEICQKLKAMENTQAIPVIFLSGLTDNYDLVKGFHLGAVDYLIKPIEIEELLTRVKTHVFINQLEIELVAANRNLEERIATRTVELSNENTSLKEEISKLKQKEATLEKETNTLKQIIDHNPYSIQVVDRKGFTISVNAAYSALFGNVPLPDYSIFDDPVLKKLGFQEMILSIMQGNVVIFPEVWYDAHEVDARLRDKKICINLTVFPIFDGNGEVEHIILMHTDITKQNFRNNSVKKEKSSDHIVPDDK